MEKNQQRNSLIIKLLIGALVVIPVALTGVFAWSWNYCVHQLTSIPRAEIVRFVTEDELRRLKNDGFGINAKIIDVLPHTENLGHLDVALLAGGKSADGKTKLIQGVYELGIQFGVGPKGQSKAELLVSKYNEYEAHIPGLETERK